jgi:hypothetical protein
LPEKKRSGDIRIKRRETTTSINLKASYKEELYQKLEGLDGI